MKILLISSYYNPDIGGGAEIMLQLQAEELAKRGHVVNVMVLTSNDVNYIEELSNGIKIYRCKIQNIYWPLFLKEKSKFQRIIWHVKDIYNTRYNEYISKSLVEINPDVAICHNLSGWSVAMWSILKHLKVPIIQVVHDYYFLCPNSNMCNGMNPCNKRCSVCKLFTIANKYLSRNIDAVVCVSKTVMNRVLQYSLFKNSIKNIIYNAKIINSSLKSNVWDGQRNIKIGFIGTLSPVKGISNLIKAFNETSINAELYIAGKAKTAKYEEYLKNLACDNSNIHFLGYYNSDLFYEIIDLAVFPSIWDEPFGLVAVEACAHGVPCIVPFWGGLSEIIIDNVNGVYCNSKDITSIKSSIERIYNNPQLYSKLVSNTHSSICEFTDINKYCNQFELLCKKLLMK